MKTTISVLILVLFLGGYAGLKALSLAVTSLDFANRLLTKWIASRFSGSARGEVP